MVAARSRRDSLLQPIRVPRAADLLVEELRRRILSGELVEGDLLPAERTMVQETGLGRATVREALRMLETEGLISAGLGRYGGWEVQRPGEATVARCIDAFIRGRQIHPEAVMETREAIEPACAALAAVHRDEDDLAHLDAFTTSQRESSADLEAYLSQNLRWHLAVVAATHNELLIAVMSALADAVHAGTDIDNFNSHEVRRATVMAHERVVDAIRAGDAGAASRRMYRHVHAFRTQAQATLAAGAGSRGVR
jgi:DNA-binding FadR family transcriptional regulator